MLKNVRDEGSVAINIVQIVSVLHMNQLSDAHRNIKKEIFKRILLVPV